MKAAKVTIGVDTPAIKKAIDEMVARVVNEAAKSLADIRAWCDQTEAEVHRQVELGRAAADTDYSYCAARLRSVGEVRALLPALPEVAEGVSEVDTVGTRVTRSDDREL